MIRADPIHLDSRPDSTPPRIPPRLPMLNSSPTSAGRTCTTRTRKIISSATVIEPNRFAVPVQAAILRSTGWRDHEPEPGEDLAAEPGPAGAFVSRGSLLRRAGCCRAGSRDLIASSETVETAYETGVRAHRARLEQAE